MQFRKKRMRNLKKVDNHTDLIGKHSDLSMRFFIRHHVHNTKFNNAFSSV